MKSAGNSPSTTKVVKPDTKRATRITRPKLLVDEVIRAIRGMIVEGRVLPGERLSENALANELGVSTTPVREAFALLKQEGLVTIQPQSGTYVFELQPGELEQLCELRFALEPVAIRLALDDPQSDLADRLAVIIEKMVAAQSEQRIADYLALDTEFHETIIASANNPYLSSAYALISAKMAALRNRLGRDPHHMAKSKHEHIAIANAIQERDLGKAMQVLVKHIARKEGSYWEHLDPANPQRLVNFADFP